MITYSLKKVGVYQYLYASCYCDDGRAERSIGRATTEEYQAKSYQPQVKRNIRDIETEIEKHESYCRLGRIPFKRADVENIISSVVSKKKRATGRRLSDAIDAYCEALRSGEMLRDKKKASEATVKMLHYANGFIRNNTNLSDVDMDTFSLQHVKTLHKALLSGERIKKRLRTEEVYSDKLSQNTAANYNTAIMMFFKYTYKEWHQNDIFKQEGVMLQQEDIDHGVYYKESEIMALYKIPLTGIDEVARDMFVYGCHTCMRVGDHYRHTNVNITPDYIVLTTRKRGSNVTIPLHPVAKEILKKYNGNPPKVMAINTIIKRVCKEAKGPDGKYLFHDVVTFKRTEGGKVHERILPRWVLTTSHTMRRSFATNAILAGMPDDWIMRIGGWKTYEAFQKYKRATNMDIANVAAQHPFFTGKVG